MSYPTTSLPTLPTPSSSYASLITQTTALVPSFTLESGETLQDVPVAYKTWGKLNAQGDNVMVICHALTGSADVEDWWGPLLGPSRAFDPTRYFIFCANVIGSPYGTVSSVTLNPDTGKVWGPEMAGSCPKDDVRLHKIVLDSLGVTSIAVVIGGSMGGMTTLEYPLCTPPGYVKHIVPLATSARHSAWCISWGEAQRQSIYSDPAYDDGYYCYSEDEDEDEEAEKDKELALLQRIEKEREKQPTRGLAAARMAALLTYRSRDSFESRFGRKYGQSTKRGGGRSGGGGSGRASGATTPTSENGLASPREEAWKAHNDGHRARDVKDRKASLSTSAAASPAIPSSIPPTPPLASGQTVPLSTVIDAADDSNPASIEASTASLPPLTNLELSMPGGNRFGGSLESKEALDAVAAGVGGSLTGASRQPQVFSAQSYLRYQGDKFTSRFDANCYIHITRKMDMHDVSYPSSVISEPPTLSNNLPCPDDEPTESEQIAALSHALSLLPPALVIGIESDGLFTTREQREIANSIPDSELVIIPSPDGHDGFLLEFEAINEHVSRWLGKKLPGIYEGEPLVKAGDGDSAEGFGVKKESLFGEAEADITRW